MVKVKAKCIKETYTVVSDDDSLIIVSLGSLDNVLYTVVNSVNSLSDSVVDTCVTYHITISEVYNDEVVLLSVDSTNQLILYLVSAIHPIRIRSLQRDGRGADPIPDASVCQERYGLDVCQLLHNGPAWCVGLDDSVPRCHQAGGAEAVCQREVG